MLFIYRLFCLVNYPLWQLILWSRTFSGKEHDKRYLEKLGLGYKDKPEGEVIWVHALGLGETLSLTLFLQKLSRKNKNKTILFTTSTFNSYKAFSRLYIAKNIIHQFAPIDSYVTLKRFFAHWQPSMALISEIDLWPLRILEAKKRNIPLILFNSRMNEKKKNKRRLIYRSFKYILRCFDYIFLQDEESRKHFIYFGVKDEIIKIIGPFKSAGTLLYQNRALEEKIIATNRNKFVWIAASLHPDEEIEILESFKLAKQRISNLMLIMVPRSPELLKDTIIKSKKFSEKLAVRTGENHYPNKETELLIIGTVGELGLWYKLAHVAFIGNSLNFKNIKTGKNPFEAVQADCVVIHGPKMLEPGYDDLLRSGISEEVSDRDQISNAIFRYKDPKNREIKIIKGRKFIKDKKQIIEKFVIDLKVVKNQKKRKL